MPMYDYEYFEYKTIEVEAPMLQTSLNALGEDRWELVGFAQGAYNHMYCCVFKRKMGGPPKNYTKFVVTLTKAGPNKIAVLKIVHDALGLGLREAQGLIESLPSLLLNGDNKAEAVALVQRLEDAGAEVDFEQM